MKKSLIVLLMAALAIAPAAHIFAVDEEELNTMHESDIIPYIESNSETGRLEVADGTVLAYLKIIKPDAKATVVLLGGHSESYVKYSELLYDVRNYDVSIYALDQRGQGFSSRALPDREKDYVADYNSYITDLEEFLLEVVKPKSDEKVVFLAHSIGAATAAAYAEMHPGEVAGLVLSSPYLTQKAGPFVVGLLGILDFFGGGKSYVPGGKPFVSVAFEDNKETHSRVRHERKFQDYVDFPEIRLGHPTNHWILEIEKLGKEVVKNAGAIDCPVLVLLAETDEYAARSTQNAFCANVEDCRSVVLTGSYHELLIETDEIRNEVLEEIRSFFDGHFF